MEEERLARIMQKRKRSIEPEDGLSAARRQKVSTDEGQAQRQNIAQAKVATGVQYPNGVVKKTWAYGFPRTGDDIKIEEVIQMENLELAVLSAFQIETDVSPHPRPWDHIIPLKADHILRAMMWCSLTISQWIASKLDEKLKVVWVLQAKTEAEVNSTMHWQDWQARGVLMSSRDRIGALKHHQITNSVSHQVSIHFFTFDRSVLIDISGRKYQLHALEAAATCLQNSPTSCCTVRKSYAL